MSVGLEQWRQRYSGPFQGLTTQTRNGWLVGPCILHAPCSPCTYEPKWGSDVYGMYQNLVEGRFIPWNLLVKANHYLKTISIADTSSEGYLDRWIVYGKNRFKQYYTSKDLTVDPGARCRITDQGAYGLVCIQGQGTINGQPLNSPKMIRFQELTEDEYFCSEQGVVFVNTSFI